MLIRVKYPDGSYDMVKDFRLDDLIETETIHSFKRSEGWVVLGVDPVRQPHSQKFYPGHDRRGGTHPLPPPPHQGSRGCPGGRGVIPAGIVAR